MSGRSTSWFRATTSPTFRLRKSRTAISARPSSATTSTLAPCRLVRKRFSQVVSTSFWSLWKPALSLARMGSIME